MNWAEPVCSKLAMAEQSCGEFPPAVPAARTRDAPFQADAKPPEICASHSSVYNHFNLRRFLCSRDNFKLNRASALAQWRQLGAA